MPGKFRRATRSVPDSWPVNAPIPLKFTSKHEWELSLEMKWRSCTLAGGKLAFYDGMGKREGAEAIRLGGFTNRGSATLFLPQVSAGGPT